MLTSCVLLELKYSPVSNEPRLNWYMYRPGTLNLRSSVFICGSFFAEAPDSKGSDRINRMDKIKPSVYPLNPVHPVQSGSFLSAVTDINRHKFIKVFPTQNSSLQSHHIFIHNTGLDSSSARGNAYENLGGKIWHPV